MAGGSGGRGAAVGGTGRREPAGRGAQTPLLLADHRSADGFFPGHHAGDPGPGPEHRLRLRPFFSEAGGGGDLAGRPGPAGLGGGALLVGSEGG